MNKFIITTLFLGMLMDLGEAGGSNCKIGGCTCGEKNINTNKPGLPANNIGVCCPPADGVTCSQYVRAGSATATAGAYCTCDFTRVNGNCLRGEQCTASHESQATLNGMAICCPSDSEVLSVQAFTSNGMTQYSCSCEPVCTGNLWKGSQCNACDPAYTGNLNGIKLCCANCQKKGLIIDAGAKTCNCNN